MPAAGVPLVDPDCDPAVELPCDPLWTVRSACDPLWPVRSACDPDCDPLWPACDPLCDPDCDPLWPACDPLCDDPDCDPDCDWPLLPCVCPADPLVDCATATPTINGMASNVARAFMKRPSCGHSGRGRANSWVCSRTVPTRPYGRA